MLKELLKGIKSLVIGGELPTPEESRIAPRVLCQYRANLRHQQQEHKTSVIDVGATGMRLEDVPEMKKGDIVQLSYPLSNELQEDTALKMEVMWCRTRPHDGIRLAGVRYKDKPEDLQKTWVWTLLEELGLAGDVSFQKRRHVRLATALKAELRDLTSGRFLTQGKVNNLSVGGALIEGREQMKKGARILALVGPHLNYPTLSIHAKVLASRPADEDKVYLHSIQFIDVSKKQLKTLERLVLNMLRGRSLG